LVKIASSVSFLVHDVRSVTGKYNRAYPRVNGAGLLGLWFIQIDCMQLTTVSGTLDWRTVDELYWRTADRQQVTVTADPT